MTPADLLAHFGTQAAIAHAMRVTPSSVNQWFIEGRIPIDRQCQAELITGGAVEADRTKLPAMPVPPVDARAM